MVSSRYAYICKDRLEIKTDNLTIISAYEHAMLQDWIDRLDILLMSSHWLHLSITERSQVSLQLYPLLENIISRLLDSGSVYFEQFFCDLVHVCTAGSFIVYNGGKIHLQLPYQICWVSV